MADYRQTSQRRSTDLTINWWPVLLEHYMRLISDHFIIKGRTTQKSSTSSLFCNMLHVYIKPETPRLNGKVERSHLTDQREFYQILEYTGDVTLQKKLAQWEDYYNFLSPHSAHIGKTPYEKLKQRMLG